MASLYFELEDSADDILLEDDSGKLLLEVISPTILRTIKITQTETVEAVLE